MDSKAKASDKPHIVCMPSPFQSHIKAMLNMAKLLYSKGFQITFVNTEFNHRRLQKSRGPNATDGLPDFRFETIPDGLPLTDDDKSQEVVSLIESIRYHMSGPFLDLVEKLNAIAPVACIVSDGFMIFTVTTAADQLEIPVVSFFTISACSFMGFRHFRALKEKGFTPLKDESYLTNGYLETVVDWIDGMKDMRLRDFPSFLRTTDPNDIMFNFTLEAVDKSTNEASAIIIHTFYALEHQVLDSLSTVLPLVYAIGPVQLLLREYDNDDRLNFIRCNLWKEEPECIEWLDSREPNSVIYVNFGSLEVLTNDQFIEFALGLADSNQHFLWIIRPDLVRGENAILPLEFVEKTGERGFIASWCAQEEVLKHPSMGGFLTHCGWNSILESIFAGVPMLCLPFAGDQPTNCRYTCVEWEMGLEIPGDVKRDEVKKLVIELMEGEKGKKLKEKAIEWKKMAEMATGLNGSSAVDLDKVINEVLISKHQSTNTKTKADC